MKREVQHLDQSGEIRQVKLLFDYYQSVTAEKLDKQSTEDKYQRKQIKCLILIASLCSILTLFFMGFHTYLILFLKSIQYMIFLIYALSLLTLLQAQCPTNCASCTNSRQCSSCKTGFMLLTSKTCVPCPAECSQCVPSQTNSPLCSKCNPPAQMGLANDCIICHASCLTCSGSADNCLTCQPGLVLSSANGKGTCQVNNACDYKNCIGCSTDSNNQNYCSSCSSGYFNLTQRCVKCNFPCSSCSLKLLDIWSNIVSPFWISTLKTVFGVTDIKSITVLSSFTNGGNFDTMLIQLKRGWTEAYFIYKALQPSLSNLNLNSDGISIFQFYQSIIQNTTTQIRRAMYGKLSQVLKLNWTFQQFQNRVGVQASKLTTCNSCAQRFILNTTGTCDICPQFCKTCKADGTCKSCESGRYLSGGDCVRCRSECAECSILGRNCTSCAAPLSKVGQTCILCADACETCKPQNVFQCLTCKKPFSLLPNESGVCFRCSQDLCNQCLSSDTQICLQCQPGSTLINGTCSICPVGCISCFNGLNSNCYSCLEGYTLRNSNCVACKAGCLQCSTLNQTQCLVCQTGSYLNKATGQCVLCDRGCNVCNENGCISYKKGFVSLGTKVVKCPEGCKVCDPNDFSICKNCLLGYMLQNGVCWRCRNGCEKCLSTSSTGCTRCINHWILSQGSCSKCLEPCLTCDPTNTSSCTSCKSSFILIGTSCMASTLQGCLQINSTDSKSCVKCSLGYGLRRDGKCIKCLSSCTGSCDPSNLNICLSCSPGFQYKAGVCYQCPLGCNSCVNGQCLTCIQGFSLSKVSNSMTCSQDCLFPCTSCSGLKCLGCDQGYYLKSDGSCAPLISCNPNCLYCPPGTFLNQTTQACDACPDKCSSCQNSTFCIQCLPGYFSSLSGKCVACAAPCKDCLNQQFCLTCTSSYTKQVIGYKNEGKNVEFSENCVACNSECRKCQLFPSMCKTCDNDKAVYGTTCFGIYTVKFKYEILYKYSQFLSKFQAENFKTAINIVTGTDSSKVLLDNIREGSTIITGTISANNESQATSIKNKLSSSLPGYNVVSYNADVYNGDNIKSSQTVEKNQANIGLIVGATVGGVALLTGIIITVYCVLKRRKEKELKQKGLDKEPQLSGTQKEIDQNWKMHV